MKNFNFTGRPFDSSQTRFNFTREMRSFELKNIRELKMVGKRQSQPKTEEPKPSEIS